VDRAPRSDAPANAAPRFLVAPEALRPIGQLTAAASHHALRVLRLTDGAPIELFDGAGASATARLIDATGRFELTGPIQTEPHQALRIRVAQALVSQQKMDWLVEKAVELGVAELVVIHCARCEIKLDADRTQRRLDHWRSCIESACRQSRRNRVPSISAPLALTQWLAQQCPDRLRLVLDRSGQPLDRARLVAGPVDLLIGPEGGFTPAELSAAQSAGFVATRIGPRVLRTETAALAAIAMLQALIGDYRF
jgi:16S rRNA (uracil1498-N3)-methyltransferase